MMTVKCPYFEGETDSEIQCCAKVNTFSSPERKEEFQRFFCAMAYYRCPIASPPIRLTLCEKNKRVDCPNPNECSSCGWNPTVETRRLEAWKKANKRRTKP